MAIKSKQNKACIGMFFVYIYIYVYIYTYDTCMHGWVNG